MNSRLLFRLLCPLLASLLLPARVFSQTTQGVGALPPEREVALQYINGIEALENGDFKRAVTSLTRAIQSDEENASYHRARGVANTLAEDFAAAIADLQTALRLRPGDRETRVWLAAAYRMSGEAARGAQYFTQGGDVPAGYASLVYNDMAMEYWSSRRGFYYDRQTRKTAPTNELIKKRFPDAARAYAQRHKAAGQFASEAVLARMKMSIESGDWLAAMKDLQSLRRNSSDDPTLRGYWAKCLLGLGNVWDAREEFTRTLCVQPLWTNGYLGRARAAATLGDGSRAESDLRTAGALGASTTAMRTEVAKIIAERRASSDAAARFANVLESADSADPLIDAALALHHWMNARRVRYDESYQDRILALTDWIRSDSGNPDRPEALARFLYNHHLVPAVWNGPRGGGAPLRPQSRNEREAELRRALELCDTALRLNKRHANAMATKAWVLYTSKRGGEAESLVNQGLSIERRNVRLLNLKSQLLLDQAAALTAQVTALRAGRTETSTEKRSDGIYEVRRHHPPSAQQLAQAAGLEAQAAALHREAQQLGHEARRVKSDVVPALLKQGDEALAGRDAKSALRHFEMAASCDPDAPQLPNRFAETYRRLGDVRGQRVFALLAEPMRETTAANELKGAWEHIARREWRSASGVLDKAAEIDLADARVLACRAVIAAARGDAMEAERHRRGALALEEARFRLMGWSSAGNRVVSIELSDVGLAMVLRLQHGDSLLAARRNEQALQTFAANVALEQRVPKEQLVELLPSAMLPDPGLDPGVVPEAPTFASIIAWSRLGSARALLASARPSEAELQFRAVRSSLANWPATAKDRETMYVVDSWARLGLAEAAYAAKDYETAFRLLMSGEGWPWRLPEELNKQRSELSDQVVVARKANREEDVRRTQPLSPRELRARSLQDELARLEKDREQTRARLQSLNLPAGDKEAFEDQLLFLEGAIRQKKEELQRLQSPANSERPQRPRALPNR